MDARLRPTGPDDYPEFVRLYPFLGNDDPLPDAERFARELAPGTVFLEEDGRAVGLVRCEVLADEGFVRTLIVEPSRRRRGYGRRLMLAVAASLRAGGRARWRLNHLAGNEPAEALYRSLGFATVHATIIVRLPWEAVERLPGCEATVGPIDPADDGAFEAALALPAGQVAYLREQGPILLGARAGRERGLARFDPTFPGAYPFRATAPALFRPLLDAMRPSARPGDRWVQLVIEDGAAAVAALEAAGATRFRELLQLAGDVP
jgi:GNAT superfamily N-acetyltransferase